MHEQWRQYIEDNNIPEESPIRNFLNLFARNNLGNFDKDLKSHVSTRFEEDYAVLLSDVKPEENYIAVRTFKKDDNGERYEMPHLESAWEALVQQLQMANTDPFYQTFEYYLDREGFPVYERIIQSDQNRVPSPSFFLRRRSGNIDHIIDQNPTFPDDAETVYERNPLILSTRLLDEDMTEIAVIKVGYHAPGWSDRNNYTVPDPEDGKLARVDFNSIFGAHVTTRWSKEPVPDLKWYSITLPYGIIFLQSESDSKLEFEPTDKGYIVTMLIPGKSHVFKSVVPYDIDVYSIDTLGLRMGKDWKKLTDDITIPFVQVS